MSKAIRIESILGREILDSRGNPTVEAEVFLENGVSASASVPSGASTGEFEAVELRDNDNHRYKGKGVLKAVKNINNDIAKLLINEDVFDQRRIDGLMCVQDGTENKSNFGANAILAVSVACAKAAAKSAGIPLYRYIGGTNAKRLPIPMMNILNGGVHAKNSIDIQEFMIVPANAETFSEAVRKCTEVFQTLKKIVPASGVGDEGGYAPDLESDEDALKTLVEAIKQADYKPGEDFFLAIDGAVSGWYNDGDGRYYLPKRKVTMTKADLIDMWTEFCDKYPIISIEDGMGEEDWDGWKMLTEKLGKRIKLVGDDLFVTNSERIIKGNEQKAANSVLIKMNQIGTLTETLNAVETAHRFGYGTVISHRSGETCDTTIADLAIAVNSGFIKTGAPSRGERTAKYNRLMKIEEELAETAVY